MVRDKLKTNVTAIFMIGIRGDPLLLTRSCVQVRGTARCAEPSRVFVLQQADWQFSGSVEVGTA